MQFGIPLFGKDTVIGWQPNRPKENQDSNRCDTSDVEQRCKFFQAEHGSAHREVDPAPHKFRHARYAKDVAKEKKVQHND